MGIPIVGLKIHVDVDVEDFSGEILSKQNILVSLASLSCNSIRATTKRSAIFAFGVHRLSNNLLIQLNITVLKSRKIEEQKS